ncbi:hypothetical protein Tco_1055853 [Tanacetum coccineum]|uniref:Uncharacterized protein n=1 Tax=Tanacetum coccineum TaxID=301880 RepID=A0ABQ5H0V8_9ASTR
MVFGGISRNYPLSSFCQDEGNNEVSEDSNYVTQCHLNDDMTLINDDMEHKVSHLLCFVSRLPYNKKSTGAWSRHASFSSILKVRWESSPSHYEVSKHTRESDRETRNIRSIISGMLLGHKKSHIWKTTTWIAELFEWLDNGLNSDGSHRPEWKRKLRVTTKNVGEVALGFNLGPNSDIDHHASCKGSLLPLSDTALADTVNIHRKLRDM